MLRIIKITLAGLLALIVCLGLLWVTNLGGFKTGIYVNQIVKMRVSPKRLVNIKTPKDYGMDYKDIDIMSSDGVRLSAWEIPAAVSSDKTIIVNHALSTTRYGSVEGLDGVSVEYLPMIKHLHDEGYNIVMYDHRGQGDSDGGTLKTLRGKEAPVSVGITEWQDVVGSLQFVKGHADYGDDQIAFISQCMGANATFHAWSKELALFSDPKIKALSAIQPPISYKMNERLIKEKTGMDIVDAVLAKQKEDYGFGFANAMEDVKSLTVPVLFSQVKKDVYTFDAKTGVNDVQHIYDTTPTEKQLIWIEETGTKPHGTGKRFDGYGYYNKYPEELLEFLNRHFD